MVKKSICSGIVLSLIISTLFWINGSEAMASNTKHDPISKHYPIEDTYIRNGADSNENYRLANEIGVKDNSSSTGRIGYLKYNLSSYKSDVANKATLRLFVRSKTTGSIINNIFGIANEVWDAGTMTWSNGSPYHDVASNLYPSIQDITTNIEGGYLLDRQIITAAGTYYEYDVTDYVNSELSSATDKIIAFLLTSENDLNVNYDSMESGSNKPELILEHPATAHTKVKKLSDTILAQDGLTFADVKFGFFPNVSGGSIVTYNGYQYTVYYNSDRHVCVARRASGSEAWEIAELTDYLFTSIDTHNYATLGISSDGVIHLTFDHHANDLHYRSSQQGIANNPAQVQWSSSLFGPVTNQLSGNTITDLSYPTFVQAPNGNLLFMYRTRGSGNGWRFLATYDSASHGWTLNGKMIHSSGTYVGSYTGTSTQRGNYPLGFVFDQNGRLHMPFIWRETPDAMSNHDINYMYSDNHGLTWKNISGTVVSQTGSTYATVESPGIIVSPIPQRRGLVNSNFNTADADAAGRIHFMSQHMPDDTPDAAASNEVVRRYFHYWIDENGNVNKTNLHAQGSNSPVLLADNGDAYFVYISKSYTYTKIEDRKFGQGKLRIARATAASNYTDWNIIYTDNSLPGLAEGLRIDADRFKKDGIISVFVQENPKTMLGEATKVRIIEYGIKQPFGQQNKLKT
ncbi:BNR-4 repeat-containing protein [Paenibacillus soyae]|uniref:BNR-4 repeat-containing protein n=2 Tax=Bacteria TaxID=2 RepID=A0A9X2S8S3_9BACL|nr:BNR-4 repeat-containing protein [Paenibacillus soyae]